MFSSKDIQSVRCQSRKARQIRERQDQYLEIHHIRQTENQKQ